MKKPLHYFLFHLTILGLFLTNITFSLHAQEFEIEYFTGLRSKGPIPEHFTTLSYEKYLKQLEKIKQNGDSHFDKKSRKAFYQSSNYWIDELMLSGKILFNDPVSDYINDIADILLKDEPELRKQLKFYAAKSPVYNAVSTDQGILFVNTGLIARVNSEAQLAFVMAHEIAHYTEKHSLNSYLKTQRIKHSKGIYKKTDMENMILNINHMSKENELDADLIGYDRFYKNSGYTLSETDSLFSSMLLSDAPFKEVEFQISFFEDEYFKFPQKYYIDTIKPIDIKELQKKEEEYVENSNEVDHPATTERALALRRMKLRDDIKNRRNFIVSEERFNTIKQLCQLESIKQQMISRDYIDAFYNAYALLQQSPDNKFLETTMASALYLISHKKTSFENNSKLDNEYSLEASEQGVQIQKVQFLFDELDGNEATIWATNYLIKVIKKYGQTYHTQAMLNDLLQDMFIYNKLKLNELISKNELVTDITINNPNVPDNDLYYLNAFASEINEHGVIWDEFYDWDKKRIEHEKDEDAMEQLSYKQQYKIEKETEKQENKFDRMLKYQGASLGINKIVVVDPMYIQFSNNKKNPLDLKKSEYNKIRLGNRITNCTDKSDLNTELLDSKSISTNSIDQFNNMALLNDWMSERSEYDFDYNFVPYSGYFMIDLLNDFNTDYFLWTGVLSEKKKKNVLTAVVSSIVLTYGITLPLVVVWAFVPDYNTYYYSVLFNLKTGTGELFIFDSFKGSDFSGDFVKSSVYDTFQQINK